MLFLPLGRKAQGIVNGPLKRGSPCNDLSCPVLCLFLNLWKRSGLIEEEREREEVELEERLDSRLQF